VIGTRPDERVLGAREMPGAEWFPGARLSYAEHVFRGRDGGKVAITAEGETRPRADWTWDELRAHTAAFAAGLRAAGVSEGDRVAAYLPNVPEAVVGLLASASIGAIWSSCSPDFGEAAVADRFSQIEPKVLLGVDGYRYGGKDFTRLDVVARLQRRLPTVERTVALPYLDADPDLAGLRDAVLWREFERESPSGLEFARLDFQHPLWVLFSSGTTGLPKPIVHSLGGILLEHLKWLGLHADAQRDDRAFWFTTTGWMMWNALVGFLLTDASIVLYDGSPAAPDLGRLWTLAEETGVTIFGTSAPFVTACMKAGVEPKAGRKLDSLRAVGSTASPLSPEGFRWIYDKLGRETWLFSASGGTDVCTAFVGGVPTLPVYEGELQARSLGCAVESWDEAGRPLVGEVGELVLTEPLPSMPVSFWGDADGSRLRESYFSTYPGVWRHGDWIEISDRGTVVIHGRSDSTINRGGVRMGTSELYRSVLAHDEIVDALVVDVGGREGHEHGWLALFVVLRDGAELDAALERRIVERLRADCSPRHVPDEIFAVPQVPRTLSGKILEVPVKRILMGEAPEQVASRDSLADPRALDWFVELRRELDGRT
jgi:acetoacetyl-CoA synthetase